MHSYMMSENGFDRIPRFRSSAPPPSGAAVLSPVVQERVVKVTKERIENRYIEVPEIHYVEKIVEIPEEVEEETIVRVVKPVKKEIVKYVKKPVYVDKVVPVPQIKYVDKYVEIPRYTTREKIVEVPKVLVVERIIPILRTYKKEKTVYVDHPGPHHISPFTSGPGVSSVYMRPHDVSMEIPSEDKFIHKHTEVPVPFPKKIPPKKLTDPPSKDQLVNQMSNIF